MDKRDQMENSFFDPERPGSIFIAIDRYHHYTPLPGNSLRFVEGNQREITDAAFYKFLSDNVNEVKSCTYVPDVEMVRYDLNWMRDVPSPDTHMPLVQVYPAGAVALLAAELPVPFPSDLTLGRCLLLQI